MILSTDYVDTYSDVYRSVTDPSFKLGLKQKKVVVTAIKHAMQGSDITWWATGTLSGEAPITN